MQQLVLSKSERNRELEEIWKTVIDGYCEVSNLGKLRSVERAIWNTRQRTYHYRKSRYFEVKPKKDGYLGVTLSFNGKVQQVCIHQLVARAFLPNPENKPQVNHIDGDKSNNKVTNLEWVTASENNYHACKTGLRKVGEEHHKAKLKEAEVKEILHLLSEGYSSGEIAPLYRVNKSLIKKIKSGECWSHISR